VPNADQVDTTPPKSFRMIGSPGLVDWLSRQNVSLACSTYQTGKLFLIGAQANGRFSVFERTFERAMGLACTAEAQTIYMATAFQVWRLVNALQADETIEGYDRYYVPQVGYTTGDLNVHDMALGYDGQPLFISTRFSCLATISEQYHFNPLWMPKFITKLVDEDRCHLNGLAVVGGKPRYVTACSQTDVAEGWREQRHDGGVVIDIEADEVIAEGLSMPHSPRWHQNKLWLLDSGNGSLGYLNTDNGRFEKVAFCPGFARGLAFTGNYAVVGVSMPRHDPTFEGLSLQNRLTDEGMTSQCGLIVIELTTGNIVEWLRMEGVIRELYDVLVLPGVRKSRLVGFKHDEIRTHVWADPQGLSEVSRGEHSSGR